ncbi:MAG: hypothetical protein M3Z23_12080 [Acidobacteriota bacterium]|nr:hypothetical protein [Acidobacteriota bacterium]
MKSLLSFTFLSALAVGMCCAQSITTFAGTGVSGFGGDGGPANLALLSEPRNLAVDGQGNLYILDDLNGRIRKVDASSGLIKTIAGNGDTSSPVEGPATQSGFIATYDIAAIPDGTLYIGDSDGLQRVTPDGNLHFVVTGGSVPGVKIGSDGIIYTGGITVIYRLDPNQTQTPIAGSALDDSGDGGPATLAGFYVSDFTTDLLGDIYIVDSQASRVGKFTPGANIRTIAGTGTRDFTGDGGPGAQAQLDRPGGIAVDVAGNVYIGDTGNNRIRRLGTDGVITTFAGTGDSISNGDGGPALQASFNYPTNLAITCTALYVTDTDRIRAISLSAPLIAQKGIADATTGALSLRSGTKFTISGCNLAASSTTADVTMPAPVSLAGTSVMLNGIPVQLLSVSPTRVTGLVPQSLAPGSITAVVNARGQSTAPVTVNLLN